MHVALGATPPCALHASAHHDAEACMHARGPRGDASLCLACECSPRRPTRRYDAHVNLGATLMDTGEVQMAELAFRRAVEAEPGHVAVHSYLAKLMRREQRLPEAARHYKVAISLTPVDPALYFGLGTTLALEGQLGRAAENLAVAIALAPANEHAYNQLGVVRDEQQRPSEAVAAFDAALVLRPGWDKASQNREGVMARKVSR